MMKVSILLIVFLLKTIVAGNIRSGRCPAPQYVSSSLPCSTEGDDDPCPWNYKCCPLTDGMRCFSPCPEFTEPCELKCPFGLKVNPSPCTVCECAEDPCLSRSCPLGTKCASKEYTPCADSGRCGFTTECVDDPSIYVDPTPKPNQCPEFWPSMGYGLQECRGADSLCPGTQKCCSSPMNSYFGSGPSESSSYCVDACEDMAKCDLQCNHGFVIRGGCRVCECAADPCAALNCPPDQPCRLMAAPCAYYPGRPPCPMIPMCSGKYPMFG